MIRVGLAFLLMVSCTFLLAGEEQLQMVGQARLQVLFWPVYDSRLYSRDGQYREGQRPLRLEIQYLRDVSAADLVANTQGEWQNLPGVPARSEQWLGLLSQLWPDVAVDDVLWLDVDEEGRSAFSINGQPLGGIDDPDFGRQFLNIWLSADTSRPELRLALIGKD